MFAAPGHTRMISHYCRQHVSDRLDKSITNVPNMYLVRHKDSLATLAPRGTPPHRQVVLTKFISLSCSLLFTPGFHRRVVSHKLAIYLSLDSTLYLGLIYCYSRMLPPNLSQPQLLVGTAGIILVFSNLCAHLFKLGEIYRCRSKVCCKPVLI